MTHLSLIEGNSTINSTLLLHLYGLISYHNNIELYKAHISPIHCVPQKNVPLCDCLYLRQILTDFQNSFTGTFCGQSAVKWLWNIPPHISYVATLPCEIWMQQKIAVLDNKRVGKQNTLPAKKMQWMICTMLHFVRFFIWIFGVSNDMFISGLCGLVYHISSTVTYVRSAKNLVHRCHIITGTGTRSVVQVQTIVDNSTIKSAIHPSLECIHGIKSVSAIRQKLPATLLFYALPKCFFLSTAHFSDFSVDPREIKYALCWYNQE